MSRSNQNYTPPEYLRTGPDYGGYSARPNGRNRVPTSLSLILPAGSRLDPTEGDHDPRWLFRERIPGGPLGISSFPAPPLFHNHPQFLDNDAQINTRWGQRAADPSSSFQRQMNMEGPIEGSKLTEEEQMKALKMLKKEIYIPKWFRRRPNLYYRDNPVTTARETEKEKDEEGKRCAICLEDFEPKEMVRVTPCNHMFHGECIVPWVKSEGQCPVCRFAICERFRQTGGAPSINTTANVQFDSDLIALIRAMEEAFVPQNMRGLL